MRANGIKAVDKVGSVQLIRDAKRALTCIYIKNGLWVKNIFYFCCSSYFRGKNIIPVTIRNIYVHEI
jgi:hypothetical protein